MALRFGLACCLVTSCAALALGQTVIVDETFDQYTSQAEFESVWTPDQGSGYQPTPGSSKGFLVPLSGIGVPPYNDPPGLQGNGVNILTGINEYNGPNSSLMANLVPSATQSIRLTGDLFDAGEGVLDHRSTIAIRNDTVNRGEFGVNGYNFLEMGLYNAGTSDPTNPTAGTANPVETLTGYAYRLTLWGGLTVTDPPNPLVRQPDYQYFQLDPALDTNADGRVTQVDIGPGWHRYTAVIGIDSVTLSLDLFRDGLNNATGEAGVDSTVTWSIFPHNAPDAVEPNPFDPFNSLRFGGPSGAASASEAVVDNIKLELIDVVVPVADNADFNGDNIVDGNDFLAWQRGFQNGTSKAQGDANGNSVVDGVDLAIWKTQFGTNPNAPPANIAVAAVPEPATAGLAVVAMLASMALVRRRQA